MQEVLLQKEKPLEYERVSKITRALGERAVRESGPNRNNLLVESTLRTVNELAGVANEMGTQHNRALNFRRSALEAHDFYGDDPAENAMERLQTGLCAYIPALIESTPTLNNEFASKADKKEAKRTIMHFNAVIKEAIAYHPEISFNNLRSMAKAVGHFYLSEEHGVVGRSFNRYWDRFENHLDQIVKGAQHESAFGDILHQYRGDIDFREATIEEDLRGADYVITQDGVTIKIDVKSTKFGVERAGYHSDDTLVLSTGLDDSDFTPGALYPRTSAVKRQANALLPVLYSAFDSMAKFGSVKPPYRQDRGEKRSYNDDRRPFKHRSTQKRR